MINFVLTADESWRAKNAQKLFAVLRKFLNLQENFVKNFALRRQLPKLLLVNFLEKFIIKKKYLIKKFNLRAEKMSLDEIEKSLKQIIDHQVTMHLQQNFIKFFLMN